MLKDTLGVILAGKRGEELQPLTSNRAKAAVPFGGKYRIIDFALSNGLNSGLRRMLVLTQYMSHSLHKHLRDGWSIFNAELGEYITAIPPQMRTGESWYRGSADALFQNLYLLERSGSKEVIILPGDHIYRMDLAPAINTHRENNAAVTVITTQRNASEWTIRSQTNNKVEQFSRVAEVSNDNEHPVGIYIFNTDFLIELLNNKPTEEQYLIEEMVEPLIGKVPVFAYGFGGKEGRVSQDLYWQDIHSLDDYYQANIDLLKYKPTMDLYQADWPIRSYVGQHPPARTAPGEEGSEGIFINSIIGNGSVIIGAGIQNSVIFNNVTVNDESTIENSIIFDNVKIGKRCQLNNCIIDKNIELADDTIIGYDKSSDKEKYNVTDNGIVVIK